MQQYQELMSKILLFGKDRQDRTGTGTRSIFGAQMSFDLCEGFPLLTTKKVYLKGVIAELLWFLNGDTNIRALQDQGVHIWDAWADSEGNLGPIYGAQWRAWKGADGKVHDQIADALELIKNDPYSRRIMVSAWNVGELEFMALPPCHCLFQFYVADGALSCHLYQRSADFFLGVPFNIASYSLLTMMMAQQADLKPGSFVWTGGDVHIYKNHFEQCREQLKRKPRALPKMQIKKAPTLFSYQLSDFELIGYEPHPAIKAPVAV